LLWEKEDGFSNTETGSILLFSEKSG